MTAILRMVGLCVALVACAAAHAQSVVRLHAAGGDLIPGRPGESHAWLVVPVRDQFSVVHVPPRGAVALGADRAISVRSGALHRVAGLVSPPRMMAGVGRDLYMVFDPQRIAGTREGAPDSSRRRVLRVGVFVAPLGAGWGSDAGERLRSEPSLPGAGELLGFAGTPVGPMAMMRQDGRVTLAVLNGGSWQPVDLPPGLQPEGEIRLLGVVGDGRRVLLIESARDGGDWEAHQGRIERGLGPDDSFTFAWTSTGLRLGEEAARAEGLLESVIPWKDRLLVARPTSQGLAVEELTREGELVRIALVAGVSRSYGIGPLYASGRVVIVSEQANAGSSARQYRVIEVSPDTGRVVYDGPAVTGGPVSTSDFRMVVAALVLVSAVVVLFVVRPDVDRAVRVPTGWVLAGPRERALAGLIDVAVAWSVVRFGGEALGWSPGGSWGDAILGIVWIQAAGVVVGTIAEALTGRTIGKALTGCRVVRSAETVAGPGLARAACRNLYKWAVPPLAITSVMEPGRPHRGDGLAQTLVVVRLRPDGPTNAPPGGEGKS